MSVITIDGQLANLREKEIELISDMAESLSELGEQTQADRKKLLDMAQDLRELFFMVAIIGEFNAGKSTFVNALIGESLLPMGITPTTEYIELIRYNETPQRKPTIREDGLREWAHPNTGANGVAIVDTPGTGSVFQRHEQTAKAFLHRSDLVIFVISAKHAFAETERMYLELAKNYGKKIILVINQIDLLEPSERQQVRRFIEGQVKELLDFEPLLFMVSAKEALTAPANGTEDPGGVGAVRAHLRGVYAEAPPAKQKLISQLDTLEQIVKDNLAAIEDKVGLVNIDMTKVKDVQSELQRQSVGLETQMKEAGASVDTVLEGIRRRGMEFIDSNLSLRKIGRTANRERLQAEFQDVVIGRSLKEINEATGDYINAVVDQSRLYWRGVIDRLNQLRDLMEQELSGMDAGIYAEQRAGLQEAIRIAEAELKSYSSGQVVADMETSFKANTNGLLGSAVVSVGGFAAIIAGIVAPGPLVGATAVAWALPVVVVGAAAAAIAGLPALRYLRRINSEAKEKFNAKIDDLIKNYHMALDELTRKERNRLTQYGNQILTPIFSRLEVLTKRYADQQQALEKYHSAVRDLRQRIKDSN